MNVNDAHHVPTGRRQVPMSAIGTRKGPVALQNPNRPFIGLMNPVTAPCVSDIMHIHS